MAHNITSFIRPDSSKWGRVEIFSCLSQGGPLSPFLFIIVAEGLGIMVNKVATEGLLGGFRVVDATPLVTYLQIADDTLIFREANEDEIRNVKTILLCFEIMLGFKINF